MAADAQPSSVPPGVVVAHVPAASGTYVGSPGLVVLPDGSYLASHDLFGPKSGEHERATTRIYRSADRGKTWERRAQIVGAFWSTLFVHGPDVYLIGTTAHHGDAVIRRSRDGGATWTDPVDRTSGLLLKGQYHCAPVPVLVHGGRVWRAFEDAGGGTVWGKRYRAMMASAPADADLLDAGSWTVSNILSRDPAWLNGKFNAWLEGNAVVAPDGGVVDLLRVDGLPDGQTAAIVTVSADGRRATFDPADGFVEFPGGATKFTVRWDVKSRRYWSLANDVLPHNGGPKASAVRNTLALTSSPDLRTWTVSAYVLHHPDVSRHGFQYVDWQFDGDDLIAVSRTAYEDEAGGAHTFHDANYLTFHRVANFRTMTAADGVRVPAPVKVTIESADLVVTGYGFAEGTLADGAKAFGNREYVWKGVPAELAGGRLTRVDGGVGASIAVRAKVATVVRVLSVPGGIQWPETAPADAKPQPDAAEAWRPAGKALAYTDKGITRIALFERRLAADEEVRIPQNGWAGTMVVLPPAAKP